MYTPSLTRILFCIFLTSLLVTLTLTQDTTSDTLGQTESTIEGTSEPPGVEEEFTKDGRGIPGGSPGKQGRFFFGIIGGFLNIGRKFADAAAGIANAFLRPIGIQIPNATQLLRVVKGVLFGFVPEWQIIPSDFILVVDMAWEYYCKRFGPFHVLCAWAQCKVVQGRLYYIRGLTQAHITMLVSFFNTIRQGLLEGRVIVGVGGTIIAKRICFLSWSEELQLLAQGVSAHWNGGLNQSLIYTTDKFVRVGIIVAEEGGRIQDPEALIKIAFRKWYGEQCRRVRPDAIYDPSGGYNDFSQIVWSESFQVGCGFSSFSVRPGAEQRNVLVCAFGPAGNVPGSKMIADTPNAIVQQFPKPKRKGIGFNFHLSVNIKLNWGIVNPFTRLPLATCWNSGGWPYIPVCECVVRPDPIIPITTTERPRPPTTQKVTKKPKPKPTKNPKPVTKKPTPKPTGKPGPGPPCKPDPINFDNYTRKFVLQQPYIALVSYEPLNCKDKAKALRCTAFIYNSQWLLTSYQCALPTLLRQQGRPTHGVATIHYGQSILNGSQSATVVHSSIPPDVNIEEVGLFDNMNANIALLKINKQIVFSKYAKTVKLAETDSLYAEQLQATVYGWSVKIGKAIKATPTKLVTHLVGEKELKKELPNVDPEFRFGCKLGAEAQGKNSGPVDVGGPIVAIAFDENQQAPVPTAEAIVLGILPVSMQQRIASKADKGNKMEYFTTIHLWNSWVFGEAGKQDMDWTL